MFFYMYHNEITKDIYIYIYSHIFGIFNKIFFEKKRLICTVKLSPTLSKMNNNLYLNVLKMGKLEYLKYYSIFTYQITNKLYLNGKLEYQKLP